MPVEVVGWPSKGDGRTPGTIGEGAGGDRGEAGEEEGPTRPTFRLRKDIACWRMGNICEGKSGAPRKQKYVYAKGSTEHKTYEMHKLI